MDGRICIFDNTSLNASMNNILQEPIENYLTARKSSFSNNQLADKFRNEFPKAIEELITDKVRYKVVGSPGKGNWTECPWIAIFDTLITETAQSGYYPVFLFKADMTGVYLSLNQGVTEVVKENYKRETKNVLKIRAEDFRAKIDINNEDLLQINLNSKTTNSKLYEAGNIIAKYYPAESLPSTETLRADILRYLSLYEELTFNDVQIDEKLELTAIEKKKYRLHFRIERNSSLSKKVKEAKGYVCEACNFDFRSKYGELGNKFIEAHHLTPISSLGIGEFKLNIKNDFAVLCSNCHSMIHKLDDPSNLNKLKTILQNKKA